MANKYLITGGGNWTGASWATASNQAVSDTTAPTTSDTAILDSFSGNVVVDSAACVCGVLNATGYTGTMSGSAPAQLWCYGSWTLSAGMTLSGDFIFKCGNSTTTGTWTTAGQTFSGSFVANGTGAKTLVGNFTVTGLMTWLQTCNLAGSGYNIDVLGGWTGTAYFNDAATNPTVTIRGGTITGTLPNSPNGCILTPSASNIVFATGIPYKTQLRETAYLIANTSTYSIVTTDAQTYFIAYNGTLKTAAMTWNSIYWASGAPTLEEDLYVTEFGVNNNTSGSFNGAGKTVHILGSWPTRATCKIGGTATYSVEGTGTIWSPTLNSSTLNGTVTINAIVVFNSSGTITIYPKNIYFGGSGSLTYTAGTMSYAAGFVPYISGTYTWNWDATLSSMIFSTNADILNLSNDLTVGTLNMFAGSAIHIADTKELTVTTAVNACANETYQNTINATSGTAKFSFTGSMANIQFAKTDFTDIDASGSTLRVDTWYGSVDTCTNVFAVTEKDIGGGGVSVTSY